jgi:hypothetical protein
MGGKGGGWAEVYMGATNEFIYTHVSFFFSTFSFFVCYDELDGKKHLNLFLQFQPRLLTVPKIILRQIPYLPQELSAHS